ncbi:MAG: DUF177 domain-containing protein [Hyphomicrobiaceae bacterium]|nr:DUF177 domain-containing protein [Hyphomicrobiaceae bacterium]
MLDELAWEHAVQDIPEEGLAVERSATPEECEAIARSLELLGCRSLDVRYALLPRGGHVHVSGALQAQVEQTCVVTLEPLVNEVAASFKVDFWPETEMPEPSGGAVDMQDEADLEPIVAGRIEVGRVVFESLAGAIDLFPRKPGVTFEQPEDKSGSRQPSPFAGLVRIKRKR